MEVDAEASSMLLASQGHLFRTQQQQQGRGEKVCHARTQNGSRSSSSVRPSSSSSRRRHRTTEVTAVSGGLDLLAPSASWSLVFAGLGMQSASSQ
jgi:hypothetical protein